MTWLRAFAALTLTASVFAETPLPEAAVSILENDGEVRAAAFSPDGKVLATAGERGVVRLWDGESGEGLRSLKGLPDPVSAVSFSRTGKFVVASDDTGAIRRWEAGSGKERKPASLRAGLRALAHDPRNDLLACGGGNSLMEVLALPSFDREERYNIDKAGFLIGNNEGNLEALAYSRDGYLLGGCGGPNLAVFDIASGDRLLQVTEAGAGLHAFAFSPDRQLAAAGCEDGRVRVWEIASGLELIAITSGKSPVRSIAFSRDGSFVASGADDGVVRFWDLEAGGEATPLKGHKKGVTCVAVSPGGKTIATGGLDGIAILWKATVDRDPPTPPDEAKTVRLWEDFASPDSARAWRAVVPLAAGGAKTVAYVRAKLDAQAAPERVASLLKDLDAEAADTRDAGQAELERLGRLAEKPVREALAAAASAEHRGRIEAVIASWDAFERLTPPIRRWLRAVTALEKIGGDEARAAIEAIARNTPSATERGAAKRALKRMKAGK
ncbi:MAG: WD40 repeat-containing [Planctomycetota bacterium]|nr:MAG: WD40 repeat-containing [Planctomycetota bacterium]